VRIFVSLTNETRATQTPLQKAHLVRAEKKKKRDEIKAKRLAVLAKAREKKRAMK